MTENAVWCYDFTWNTEENQVVIDAQKIELAEWTSKMGKKWTYQLERGETEKRLHWQGRISLKAKKRKHMLHPELGGKVHWTPTSSECSKGDKFYEYCTKNKTREAGPWTSKDAYVPRQWREVTTLYPWQQEIIDSVDVWDSQCVNFLYNPEGGIGKSTLVGKMRAMGIAKKIPFVNDYKDIMRMAYCMGAQKCFLIDMPRAIRKDKLFQMYAAIEELKGGYCYDDRYAFKDLGFDSPVIWVFSNMLPDLTLLSDRRWKLWEVDDEEKLKALAL